MYFLHNNFFLCRCLVFIKKNVYSLLPVENICNNFHFGLLSVKTNFCSYLQDKSYKRNAILYKNWKHWFHKSSFLFSVTRLRTLRVRNGSTRTLIREWRTATLSTDTKDVCPGPHLRASPSHWTTQPTAGASTLRQTTYQTPPTTAPTLSLGWKLNFSLGLHDLG